MFGFFKEKKGCLHGKTAQQKVDFFTSLRDFALTDQQFFEEQYWDLLPAERDEFYEWLMEDIRLKKQLKQMVDVVEILLKALSEKN